MNGRYSAKAGNQEKGGSYFYRVPLFRELLLKDKPEVKLEAELRDAFLR